MGWGNGGVDVYGVTKTFHFARRDFFKSDGLCFSVKIYIFSTAASHTFSFQSGFWYTSNCGQVSDGEVRMREVSPKTL